jgi:hypothetical protein
MILTVIRAKLFLMVVKHMMLLTISVLLVKMDMIHMKKIQTMLLLKYVVILVLLPLSGIEHTLIKMNVQLKEKLLLIQ